MADDKNIASKREDPRIAAARKRAASMAKAGPSWTSSGQFLKDTWSELKKTTWPDRQTLVKSTLIVLAFIAATAVWNGTLDAAMTRITQAIFNF